MKCGYFGMQEYANPYSVRYDCRYFGYSSNTEKGLCKGCYLDNTGTPHNPTYEKEEDDTK